MDQNEVVKRLRGPRGSEVRLGIQRSGIDGLIPVTVRRDAIPIKSITASYLIRPDIGYIKFDQFSVNAYKELSEAIPDSSRDKACRSSSSTSGQLGRPARTGHRDLERVPARRQDDRLHAGPRGKQGDPIQRRARRVHRRTAGRADRRIQRLVERDSGRSASGQRPGHDHRPAAPTARDWSKVRSRSRTARRSV